jgi:hypothetical protein
MLNAHKYFVLQGRQVHFIHVFHAVQMMHVNLMFNLALTLKK